MPLSVADKGWVALVPFVMFSLVKPAAKLFNVEYVSDPDVSRTLPAGFVASSNILRREPKIEAGVNAELLVMPDTMLEAIPFVMGLVIDIVYPLDH